MATVRRRITPAVLQQRAKKSFVGLDDWITALLAQPCPSCGYASLTIDDPTLKTAIVIYCERAFCRWKPGIPFLQERKSPTP